MSWIKGLLTVAVIFAGGVGVGAIAQNKGPEEHERVVQEKDVPKAALAALKTLAKGAPLTKIEEETEHGHTFYEGGWKGENGIIEGLVTAGGDLVEIEEAIPSEKVPQAVRDAINKEAGANAKVRYEKKTQIMYEAHFKKGDRHHEIVMTPDARKTEQEVADKED